MTSIVLAADDRYLPFVACTLAQLARFGRHADGITLVVPATTAEAGLAEVAAAADVHQIKLDVVAVSELDALYSDGLLIDSEYISHFTYAKLLLTDRLPHLDDVLYLDVDTLIRAPLDGLLSWDLRYPLGAVEELGLNSRRMFSTSREPYFNAGVLRMSLERMRQERIWEQAKELLAMRPGLRFQDQDILNLLFRDRFDLLPLTYNVFDSLASENRDLWTLRDPAIVHFAGPVKPWHSSAKSRFACEWRRQHAEALRANRVRGVNVVSADRSKPPDKPPSRPRRLGVVDVARRALPEPAKKAARSVALDALDQTIARLDATRTTLELGSQWRANLAVEASSEGRFDEHPAPGGDCGMDLLISVPHSGAELLARAIQTSVHGVTVVTVFPEHLHPAALEETLRKLRPRIIILRREMVFSSMPDELSESAASDYVAQCDSWFDRAVRLVEQLGLQWISLTYDGLFACGSDVPHLATFYPGACWPVHPESGALCPADRKDDSRSDASILAVINSVTTLSAATQASLLRLPGTHVHSRPDGRSKR